MSPPHRGAAGQSLGHRAASASFPFTAVAAKQNARCSRDFCTSFLVPACPRCPSDPGGKQAAPGLQAAGANGAGARLRREELHDLLRGEPPVQLQRHRVLHGAVPHRPHAARHGEDLEAQPRSVGRRVLRVGSLGSHGAVGLCLPGWEVWDCGSCIHLTWRNASGQTS